MPIEIEAKMKVDDHAAIRERLHECAAEHVGEFLEINSFFDTEDRSLLAADEGLRLRQRRDLATNDEAFILTFKGPRQHGPLKSREEIELTVGSGHDAMDLLLSLGFARVLTFEKKRQSWRLDGCQVELDDVPHLGLFVEIEGPREDLVMSVRDKLGLSARPVIKASYIAMLMTHLQERGIADRVVTFPS
jgi:adenylate cyclase class 2